MASYGRQRKRRDVQQYIFDDFTKCKGLTQEELNQDLKLMKLGQYAIPSTKYKICNPISKEKRQILTSIYDQKSIASDLAKQNNQLLRELTALKKQTQTTKDEIIHNQTQVTVYKLAHDVVQRQFELIEQQKHVQIEALTKYRNECQTNIALTEHKLQSLIGITTESATSDQQLMNALQYIRDLQSQLKEQREIVALIKQRELLQSPTGTVTANNTNDTNDTNNTEKKKKKKKDDALSDDKNSISSLLALNQKITDLQQDSQQQHKANAALRTEKERLQRELTTTKEAFDSLYEVYKTLNDSFTRLQFDSVTQRSEFEAERERMRRAMESLQKKCDHHHAMALSYASRENEQQVLNAAVSLEYYHSLLMEDGLKKGNAVLQSKHNELSRKMRKLSAAHNESTKGDHQMASSFQLEHVLLEEKRKNASLAKQLHAEKQKFFDRVVQFKDDLDVLYRRAEGTAQEVQRMKKEAKSKTVHLQQENERLRDTLKQSHSNIRVKQTEAESVHKRSEQQHQQTVKQIHGTKIDLEKRVEVLKSAISDLYGALSDGQVQMLSFQKQVFEEMHCSMPKDKNLLSVHPIQKHKVTVHSNSNPTSGSTSKVSSPMRSKSKMPRTRHLSQSKTDSNKSPSHSRKRQREESSNAQQSSQQSTPTKRRKKSTPNMVGTTFQVTANSNTNHSNNSNNANAQNAVNANVGGNTHGAMVGMRHSQQNAVHTKLVMFPQSQQSQKAQKAQSTQSSATSSHSISTSNLTNTMEDEVDIDSSSSSEVSHASHSATDDELYTFQAEMENPQNDAERTFYSILSHIKTDGYILLNECIKITRRGHPDYTGRVEAMFLEKASKQKKVCVTIFQLASDIPNIHECRILNDDHNQSNKTEDKQFHEGKREYIQLVLSKKHQQYKAQKEGTKLFPVGRIHTNKKVTLWFPKRNMQFKAIERKTSGRDVYFCRYRYDKSTKTLTRIDGHDEGPSSDYQ